MKKILFILLLSGFGFASFGQSENQTNVFNLGFEELLPGTTILKDWNIKDGQLIPGGKLHIDKDTKHYGNQSLLIERHRKTPENNIRQISLKVKTNGEVQTISGSFWIKTATLTENGYCWLYMEDAEGKKIKELQIPILEFYLPGIDSMRSNSEWKQYFLNYYYIPVDAHTLSFGFSFNGTGKIWIDDINLYLDSKSVQSIEMKPRLPFKAYSDTKEFRDGSGITIDTVTPFQIKSLSLLCKVWGFLKYYHPAVASGNYNWDFELFRFLPGYLNLTTKEKVNIALIEWINSLGEIPPCFDCLNPVCKALETDSTIWEMIKKPCCDDSLKLKIWYPDFTWMNDSTLVNDNLLNLLTFIKENRYQGKQYYIKLLRFIGYPTFLHEDYYDQFAYPDSGYRLLCLFRFWNMMQYWFSNKHLLDENWINIPDEFIPKLISSKNELEYLLTTEQLTVKLQDGHTIFLSNSRLLDRTRGIYYPPFNLRFVDNEPVIQRINNDSLASLSNFKRGDIIKMIDGKLINEVIKENLPSLAGSNYPSQLRQLSDRILRSNEMLSELIVEREDSSLKTKLIRYTPESWSEILPYNYQFPYMVDSSFFFIRPEIGYINIWGIKVNQLDSVFTVLKNSRGLIIDCRNYPGERPTTVKIAEHLFPDEKLYCSWRFGNEFFPGLFVNYSSKINPITVGKKNENHYKGKVCILMNEYTGSASELGVMIFRQTPGSVVIGSTTAGADGPMISLRLPGGILTSFSGPGPLNPDESETQRVGIIPDIEVKPTVKGIRKGIDEYVEKAVEIILHDKI